jgi:uroporphyrinogen-III synthase
MSNSPEESDPPDGLRGLSVCSFESRKASEIRGLLERQGACVTVAPSMREVPLAANSAALEFAEQLIAGGIDIVIFLTGVGARSLAQAVEVKYDRDTFFAALRRAIVVVRGPKPAAVLREWKVPIHHQAPEPSTWRELLALLDECAPVAGKTVAVQEYGQANPELYEGLADRQAHVIPVPVYRWELPEDTAPLRAAIERTIAGDFDVLLFTSAQQFRNVLEVADSAGLCSAWLAAAKQCVVGSIGPTASEALTGAGLPADVEPEHPKMGHLVIAAANAARPLLKSKRSGV